MNKKNQEQIKSNRKMKKSNYNVFFSKNKCVLSYNTFTDNYVIVSHKAHEIFENEDLDIFKNICPSVFDSFRQSGFIINDEMDETIF
jgi:hypothetical protein